MLFHQLFSHLGIALAALPTSSSNSLVSAASGASVSSCTRLTLDNWREAMVLPHHTPELGGDSQMWIYMHEDRADMDDSSVFEVSRVCHACLS